MMFSLARALFSPASAEDRSSLFGWFIDSMARSDSSGACVSALWLCAFADRPRSLSGRGAPEVSRFSCMLFLSVRGFLDYAGPTAHSRFVANSPLAFLRSGGSQRPDYSFFEAQSPGPPIPLSTLRVTPRDASRKTQGQDGVAVSFLVGLFHSLQHAGLTRRSLVNVSALPDARLGNAVEPSGCSARVRQSRFERGRPVCGRRVRYVDSIEGRNGAKVCPG